MSHSVAAVLSGLRHKEIITSEQYRKLRDGLQALKVMEALKNLDRIYPNDAGLDELFAIVREKGLAKYIDRGA